MARFCSKECEQEGGLCDFCTHYKDEYRDIKKLKDKNGNLKFAGEGICDITKENVMADDGYKCNNFECFMIDNKEEK